MENEQLLAYVKKQLDKGIVPEAVKAALLKAGWPEKDAAEAMAAAIPPVPAAMPVPAVPPVVVSPSIPSMSALPQEPSFSALSKEPAFPATPSNLITSDELTSLKSTPSSSVPADLGANLQLPVEPVSSVVPSITSSVESKAPSGVSAIGGGPEIVSINPAPVEAKPQAKKSSPLIAAILVVFILAIGAFGYWYATREEVPPQAPVVAEEETPAPAPAAAPAATSTALAVATTTAPVEDFDITEAKKTFEKIREANSKKDATLEKQYLSKQTLTTLAVSPSWKPIWYKDFEFVSAVKEGENVVMKINSVKDSGASSTADTVFVKETDGWKLGIAETIQRMQLQKAIEATSTPAVATSTATSTKPVASSTTP